MSHDPQADFIDEVGSLLAGMGLPRMGAKAFAALITAPEEGLTAREIGERISASPAAISGATRMLTHFSLARRSRRSGERSDRFTIEENFWEEALAAEVQSYGPMIEVLERGLADLDLSTAARDRMTETRDFLAFFLDEMPRILQRWRESRTDR